MAARNTSEQKFFFGKTSRPEAETLLSGMTDGLYLVRTSSAGAGEYVLSMCADRQIAHYQVKSHGEIWYRIDDGPLFRGLGQMVEHYTKDGDGLPCMLTRVVDKIEKGASKRVEDTGNGQLHNACLKGDASTIKKLLSKKTDPIAMNALGRIPLQEAVRGGKLKAVEAILSSGVAFDMNHSDCDGWTALHLAALQPDPEIARALILGGAVAHAKTKDGESPANIARRYAHAEVAMVLDHATTDPRLGGTACLNLKQSWFHGKIPRAVAEHILTANGSADGLFLVRESSQVGDYALSVAHEGQPQHFVIMQYHAKPGCYFIDDGPIYEGCDRIIEYYRQQEDGLPCKLTSYCPRTVSEKRPQPLRPSGAKLVEVKQTEPRMARRQTGMKKSGGGDESSDDDGDDYNHMNTPDMKSLTMQGGGGGEKKDAAIIRAEEIELGKELGKGEFGEVLKGRWTRRGKDPIAVAVKTLRADAVGAGTAEFMREAEVMSSLEHDYVTRLLGVCLHPTMMIVQELVPHGALLGYLPRKRTLLSGKDSGLLVLYATQIACGMRYLTKMKMVHRDLATRNILVYSEHQVKISDFGLSRAMAADENYYKASAGGKWPVKWYAPESVYFGKFTHASDCWSFGVTMWEIWTFGELPYGDKTGREVLESIDKGDRLDCPPKCPQLIYKAMRSCWEYQPADRPSFDAILNDIKKNLPARLKDHLRDR